MQILVSCSECLKIDLKKSKAKGKRTKKINGQAYIQINDQNVYEFICPQEHKNAIILQEEKFELLFESAANAILDGYYREAVSSIASGLERFYEFFINIIIENNGINNSLFEKIWKLVKNQSERQLGAFLLTYLYHYNKFPPVLHDSQICFRNKVIHNGFFPDYKSTIEYGNKVLHILYEMIFELKKTNQMDIDSLTKKRMSKLAIEAKRISNNISTVSNPSIINLNLSLENFKPYNLENYLLEIKDRRKLIRNIIF
jgi:hypothetical protein